MTQTARILAHLKAGKRLTPLEALRLGMGMRLGARIHQLREAGYPIKTTLVRRGGARVAEYRL